MKQGLQLKFSQQLTMTPQLQQAIKLLQLSTLELSQEITEQLYSNPLLEEITEDQDAEHQLKKTNDEKTLTETSNLIAEELEEPSKNTEPLSQETDQNDWDSDFDNYSVETQDIARINNNDGNIRGFYNVCQHRGNKLCQIEEGELDTFSCPFHGWKWNNDGTLNSVFAPEFQKKFK